ncbi:hypothetical protein LTS18_009288 [Coniosporium uncinatum]|uniref:Uncharacterized protein n=1 Tax=Coniosporium uncinatum TaxID=93489 RepID=A0ACC3DZI7_9PEZI|nr:hypothetical protein LTS18_009288 [Coniosporium uncinatum]
MASQPKDVAQTLTGKVALVSGSSSGIGKAVAVELSRRGASIVLNYPFSDLKAEADEVLAGLRSDVKSVAVEADLSTTTGPSRLIDEAVAVFGHIDILVNNAGRAGDKPLEDVTLHDWDSMINLNARGTLLLTQAALKHLSRQNSRIVNITSSTARDAQANFTVYSGTKAMIDLFTRVWAKELPRKYGCTVNSVAPGPVNTEMMMAAPEEFKKGIQSLVEHTPVAPRMAHTWEIGYLVAMLCEEGAGWANGVYLVGAGGLNVG